MGLRGRRAVTVAAVLSVAVIASFRVPTPALSGVRSLRVRVLGTFRHDPTAFTEGLVMVGARLFESVGLEGQSDVREVNLATGTVLRRKVLAEKVFGEGLAAMPDGSLIQLSWKNRTAYRWDSSLGSKGTFAFTGEGWGLCYDAAGRRFVQSDGTATLTFRNTATFARLGGIVVRRGGRKVDQINELECDSHSVLANVWHSAEILRISLSDGHVTEAIDASPLGGSDRDPEDVLNGIARLPNGHWLLTGKRWPLLYEVTFELR